jgi:hypothetical protein
MTISYLSFRTPYSAYRDCMIVIQPQGPSAYRAVCVDAATRLTIGCPSVPRPPDGRRPAISAADVIGMVGGYRLASAAVDIEMDELARQTRLIAAIVHGAPEHVELPQLGIHALCQQPERRTGRKDSSRAGSFLKADDEGTAARDPDAAGLGDLGAAGGWRDP